MDFSHYVRESTQRVFEAASQHCKGMLDKSRAYLAEHASSKGLDLTKICYAVGGSFGRSEALHASDFDLIPIFADEATYQALSVEDENTSLRKGLRDALGGVDVSRGRSVTSAVRLDDLIDPSKIGGRDDTREALTRRIIMLTEAAEAGGALPLSEVRSKILDAYTKRTSDSHPLALCNDVARYYRTLCMDYKAKVGSAETDWAESNVKLRHSRKVWYFASVLAIAAVGEERHPGSAELSEKILAALARPPSERLFEAVGTRGRISAGRVLDQYAWYLDFMSDKSRREELNRVDHPQRYSAGSSYASLQWNSKVLHSEMINVLNQIEQGSRDRVIEWFLF